MSTQVEAREILRFATAGSVDDGKSSLIGRLLFDSKSILEDQMQAIEDASRLRGSDQVELALLTDGLRAEREQNITIDVAYRYFTTSRRKFIIADTPGHLQYTRNMVTGTSTADLSVILIDARKGVLTQSKRHAAISSLLGLPHLVVAVNKMDLVDFSEMAFETIRNEFEAFTRKLGVPRVTFIPISALLGDNVVESSNHTPWYNGPTLLEFLETVQIPVRAKTAFRMPVQYVIRPNQDFRGFAGQVECGQIQTGDVIAVASTGITSRVRSIFVAGREVREVRQGSPAVITLDHEIDVSRGEMFVSPTEPTQKSDRFRSILSWLQEAALEIGKRYILAHGTRRLTAVVESVIHRVDVDSLAAVPIGEIHMNDIGLVVIRTSDPVSFDSYSENPATGSFVLIDPGTNVTVAGGMIQGSDELATSDLENRLGSIIWLDDWSELGRSLAEKLRQFGHRTVLLKVGDFESFGDPIEGISRVALSSAEQGFNVLVSMDLRPEERDNWNGPGRRLTDGESNAFAVSVRGKKVFETLLAEFES
jgi:bifunctional enzyme CysN/CysC